MKYFAVETQQPVFYSGNVLAVETAAGKRLSNINNFNTVSRPARYYINTRITHLS